MFGTTNFVSGLMDKYHFTRSTILKLFFSLVYEMNMNLEFFVKVGKKISIDGLRKNSFV